MKLEETKRTSRILEIVQIIAVAPGAIYGAIWPSASRSVSTGTHEAAAIACLPGLSDGRQLDMMLIEAAVHDVDELDSDLQTMLEASRDERDLPTKTDQARGQHLRLRSS